MLSQQLATVSDLAHCAVQSRWGPYGHRAQTPKFILPKKEFDTTLWTIITKQIWEINILMSIMFMYLMNQFFIFDVFYAYTLTGIKWDFLSGMFIIIFISTVMNWPVVKFKPSLHQYQNHLADMPSRVLSRFFVWLGHETMHAFSGNTHFFTK